MSYATVAIYKCKLKIEKNKKTKNKTKQNKTNNKIDITPV